MEKLSHDGRRILFAYLSWLQITKILDIAIDNHWYNVIQTALEFVDLDITSRSGIKLVCSVEYSDIMDWMIHRGYVDRDNTFMCSYAAGSGNMKLLTRLREIGFNWDETACRQAASNGRIEMLEWLIKQGCPWDGRTTALAVRRNYSTVLELM